jgi:hypothetical protein
MARPGNDKNPLARLIQPPFTWMAPPARSITRHTFISLASGVAMDNPNRLFCQNEPGIGFGDARSRQHVKTVREEQIRGWENARPERTGACGKRSGFGQS